MSHLLSYYSQIEPNLRRTAQKGLISLLNQQQLEDLALKYFGIKDEYGNVISYQCPYSGEIYYSYEDIVLEHIIPVNSNGGTVLFNCIPTSKKVNGTDEKGAKHLISWWINSKKYWDEDAPKRLEKIVNYMLDGYDQVFEQYTVEEVESSYLEIESDESILDEEDNIHLNARTESKLLKQAKNNGIHSYLGFILDCINTLENKEICNIDTTVIRRKLTELTDKHIFENIERYQLYQNIIQKLIISRIGDDNRSYLTYTLNFDIKKLIDSINLDNEQDIYNELNIRLTNIEQLLKINNLSTKEYFKSIRDIQDIDIIYKNIKDISKEDLKTFLENIKIGIDTKIEIFINMLNKGNKKILSQKNREKFENYPNVSVGYFFQDRKEIITHKLFEELKEESKYNVARKIILEYYKVNTIEEYYQQQKEKEELKNSLTKEEIDFQNNLDLKINCFIEMLNKGNSKILSQRNTETFEGYNNTPVGKFWMHYKKIIRKKLFEELKEDSRYAIARETINNFLALTDKEKRVTIFIEMLNRGNSNILNVNNNETFEGYDNIKIGMFWHQPANRTLIMKRLFEELKEDSRYDTARKLINEFLFTNDINKKIDIFIDMLNKGNSNILNQRNNETFEGYGNIRIGTFWNRTANRTLIMKKLFEELKDDSRYDTARNLILNHYKVNTIEEYYKQKKEQQEFEKNLTSEEIEFRKNFSKRINCFIEMLNKGNTNILNDKNNEIFDGYLNTAVGSFWQSNKDLIIKRLFEELKNDSRYDMARKLLDEYILTNDTNKKIDIFIEMLNQGNSNILKSSNNETFEGYDNIKIGTFWHQSTNRTLIMKRLFEKLKDDSRYDTARNLIEQYFVQSNSSPKIDIFIEMLNNGNSNILNASNSEIFEGYENIRVGTFWHQPANRTLIMKKLFEELKDDSRYDMARKLIDEFLFINDINKKIDIFIEMLNQGNGNILKSSNNETFEGYSNIKVGKFWFHHQDEIQKKLLVELKDNSKYDKARELIAINEMTINVEKQISIFINMLNKGNSRILKRNNKEKLEGYSNINLAYFWNDYQDRIKQKLFVELKDNPEYDTARKLIEINEVEKNIDKKIEIFINMLNKGNSKILKQGNKETLEDYPSINLATFWNANKDKIKPKLFIELKDNPYYDKARQTVLTYFKVSSYEELEAKASKGKKLKEDKKIKQELEEAIKYIDEVDLNEQEQRKRA